MFSSLYNSHPHAYHPEMFSTYSAYPRHSYPRADHHYPTAYCCEPHGLTPAQLDQMRRTKRPCPRQWNPSSYAMPHFTDTYADSDESSEDDEQQVPTLDDLFLSYFEDHLRPKKTKQEKSKDNKMKQQKSETIGAQKSQRMSHENVSTINDFVQMMFGGAAPRDSKTSVEKPGTKRSSECSEKELKSGQNSPRNCRKDRKMAEQMTEKKVVFDDAKGQETSAGEDGVRIISKLSLKGFDPDSIEIKVQSAKRTVQVTARHAVLTPLGPYMRQQSKTVAIPEGVDTKDIRSFLTPDNILIIQAENQEKRVAKEKEKLQHGTETSSKKRTETQEAINSDAESNEEAKIDDESKHSDLATLNSQDVKVDEKEREHNDTVSERNEDSVAVNTELDTDTRSPGEATCEDKSEPRLDILDHEERLRDAAENRKDDFEIVSITEMIRDKSTDGETTEQENESADTSTESALDSKSSDTPTETSSGQILAQFELAGFAGDDIKVSFKNNYIEISAKREDETEKGTIIREYFRALPIPEDVDPKKIQTKLDVDDIFYITKED